MWHAELWCWFCFFISQAFLFCSPFFQINSREERNFSMKILLAFSENNPPTPSKYLYRDVLFLGKYWDEKYDESWVGNFLDELWHGEVKYSMRFQISFEAHRKFSSSLECFNEQQTSRKFHKDNYELNVLQMCC